MPRCFVCIIVFFLCYFRPWYGSIIIFTGFKTHSKPLALVMFIQLSSQKGGKVEGISCHSVPHMTVWFQASDSSHVVRQFHLLGWPEEVVGPEEPAAVLHLLEAVELWQEEAGGGPITVQCKYGGTQPTTGTRGNIMIHFIKITRSWDRLIFIIGFHWLYIATAPEHVLIMLRILKYEQFDSRVHHKVAS